MGNTPRQKRQKQSRSKKERKRKQPADPRTFAISIGGPIKISKADGTVEYQPASSEWKNVGNTDYLGNPYRKARPKKY